MSNVAKVIEVSTASSTGLEDAIQSGLKKVASSVSDIQGAWVSEIKVRTHPDGQISQWRVCLRVSFVVD